MTPGLLARRASSRRLLHALTTRPAPHTADPITVTVRYLRGTPDVVTIASITGPHRLVRAILVGEVAANLIGTWDISISDNPYTTAAATATDPRLSGATTPGSGFHAADGPDEYALNVVSRRPLTFYKPIVVTAQPNVTLFQATLVATRL